MAVQAPEQQTSALIPQRDGASQVERVVIQGNLAELKPEERVAYYAAVCESVGLNPLTKPFEYITLNGKLVLYATKSCTEQLRPIRGISIDRLERETRDGLAMVTAYGHDRTGRMDSAIGAVAVEGLKGEALANAWMKAETKSKRRLTLSLGGLGILDEVEVESVPGAWREPVDLVTGEIGATQPKALADRIGEQAAAAEALLEETPADAPPPQPAAEPPTTRAEAPGVAPAQAAAPARASAGGSAPSMPTGGREGFTAWLREHRIDPKYALEVAKKLFGPETDLRGLSDADRERLAQELTR